MKKTNKFAYILLIIVIIIILILSYMLMTKNTTIQRQAKEIETMTATTDNAYALNTAHKSEDIKVWNKTYAYNDYTWDGVAPSATSYVGLTSNSNESSGIYIDLDDSEIIDASKIQAWTIRLWASESPDSTAKNGYAFRKSRGTNSSGNTTYWYELPILHADYDPDLKLLMGIYKPDHNEEGRIKKHYQEKVDGEVITFESTTEADSIWVKPTSIGNGNSVKFSYDSQERTMKISFTRDDYSPYAVRGYIVADITIYYK